MKNVCKIEVAVSSTFFLLPESSCIKSAFFPSFMLELHGHGIVFPSHQLSFNEHSFPPSGEEIDPNCHSLIAMVDDTNHIHRKGSGEGTLFTLFPISTVTLQVPLSIDKHWSQSGGR